MGTVAAAWDVVADGWRSSRRPWTMNDTAGDSWRVGDKTNFVRDEPGGTAARARGNYTFECSG